MHRGNWARGIGGIKPGSHLHPAFKSTVDPQLSRGLQGCLLGFMAEQPVRPECREFRLEYGACDSDTHARYTGEERSLREFVMHRSDF